MRPCGTAAPEAQFGAEVVSTSIADFALIACYARLNRHSLPHLPVSNSYAELNDDARELVSQTQRLSHLNGAIASLLEVVDVGAAQGHRLWFDENISDFELGDRLRNQRQLPRLGQILPFSVNSSLFSHDAMCGKCYLLGLPGIGFCNVSALLATNPEPLTTIRSITSVKAVKISSPSKLWERVTNRANIHTGRFLGNAVALPEVMDCRAP